LHEIFYASLMAENQRRMQHLEGAIHRLHEKTDGFARRCRALRQEEITEEIEVILLSVEGTGLQPVLPKD
jgi:F-type H+-transporting ATPase subunit gamma